MNGPSISLPLLQQVLGFNNLETCFEKLLGDVYTKVPSIQSHHIHVYESDLEMSSFLEGLQPGARKAFAQRKIITEFSGQIILPLLSAKRNTLGVIQFHFWEGTELVQEEITYLETISLMIAMSVERNQNEKESKRILRELQSSQERLGLALQSQKMGVWDWDIVNNKLYWDDTMMDIFGVDPKNFRGNFEAWESTLINEDLESINQIIQLVLANKMDYDHHFRINRNGEIRFIAAIGSVIRDEYGNAVRFTGLNWDITDKVLANKKIEQERAKAIANSKMASLGEMASGIAHEINNPLTIILNRTSQLKTLLHKDLADKNKLISEIDKIENTFGRIIKIIRGLKAFSRNADNDPLISCDINSIVDETMELCLQRFKTHGIQVSVDGLDHLYYLSCRPSQISQVLLNLLNNSFDAIVKSLNPWIQISIKIKNELNGTFLQVCIVDSGKGIPTVIADKMMDPFFTTKDVGQGTGLGLPISKGIVEDHKGRLWLDREAEYTTFVVELPLEEIVAKDQGQALNSNESPRH